MDIEFRFHGTRRMIGEAVLCDLEDYVRGRRMARWRYSRSRKNILPMSRSPVQFVFRYVILPFYQIISL